MLVSSAYAAPALAQISDTIHPYASTVVVHDDNLFRLDDGEERNGGRADTYKQLMAGVSFAIPVERQKFSGDLRVSRVTFERFDQLDYNGKDAQGEWAWQLGNLFNGHLGGSYSQTLAPFADFNTTERNLRVQRREYADATYRIHPRWQVHGSYTNMQARYSLTSQNYGDRDDKISELGFDFLTPTGSRIGVQARRIDTSYPNGTRLGLLISDDYIQDELKLNVMWRFSQITQIQFLGGRERRRHQLLGYRDDSGNNGRIVGFWTPREKLKFTAQLYREFSVVESSTVNTALSKGGSLDGTWQATTKVAVTGQLRNEKRDFGSIVALSTGEPNDRTKSASLTLSYVPLPSVELDAGVTRSSRNGNFTVGSGNFKSNSVSFSAKITF